MKTADYDGIYFIPHDEDPDGMKIAFFNLNEEFRGGESIGGSPMGDCWHVVYFKTTESGVEMDDPMEAIFADPAVYVEGLAGGNIYGCMVRKTTKSGKWFQNYLENAKNYINMLTADDVEGAQPV